MGNSSDIHSGVDRPASRNGVNDPVGGVDVKRTFDDNQTPHERAQWAADVRADPSPKRGEPFLPEALRRRPTSPINPRTGRRATD
ncbi:hypothetical protein [Bradyrhizobium elkanii]|uniref:hypothetical protein n=1 Tax=Bradyrhizobium elkanii TaxID=29448 RepID=UPI000841A16A|nr:hypothetical protein [Bradyrhizobium elkanii]MCP1973230.1 hypothetical protein [Bradyrhizobium elkanii]MCS3520341.1 hypothetical protein [Bradyrhizobium elkanii]MCS4067996.1 hypothetical protein [Bradyrhizobium elkanii]MCS4083532.1 hypothetical protein [Bradyrhizobium elkanii]MCS4105265.1 hypothetical protein [Bradyrhizobium elkanii]